MREWWCEAAGGHREGVVREDQSPRHREAIRGRKIKHEAKLRIWMGKRERERETERSWLTSGKDISSK